MLKENQFIQQYHKGILAITVIIPTIYILDIIKYNTLFGPLNFKWIAFISLLVSSWIVYEFYLLPQKKSESELQHPPRQQYQQPRPIRQPPRRSFRPASKTVPRSLVAPGFREQPPAKEQQIPPPSPIKDDSLPKEIAEKIGISIKPVKKEKPPKKNEKEKTAFENFGLE